MSYDNFYILCLNFKNNAISSVFYRIFFKKALDKAYDICYNVTKTTDVVKILSSFLLIGAGWCVRQMRSMSSRFVFCFFKKNFKKGVDKFLFILYNRQVRLRKRHQIVPYGSIAQLGEHLPYKQRVIGSNPIVPTNGPVVQLVRTLACHARGRGFESHPGRQGFYSPRLFASVAQLVEQRTENPRVVGSIPTGGTIYADLAHLVERHLAKVEVAGSSPVIRSN